MKKLILILLLLPITSFGELPFNGCYSGRGEVSLTGRIYYGRKVLEVATTPSRLRLIRSNVILDAGGYMQGRQEEAQVIDGEIIYQGDVVGLISEEQIHVNTNISGYGIEYVIKNLGAEKISYSRYSTNQATGFHYREIFAELKKGACPPQNMEMLR